MRKIESVKMTKDLMLNKCLITNIGLEERIGPLQPIKIIEDLFDKRKLSKKEVKEILYSKYRVNEHIFEYSDRVLIFLARLGIEVDKVCKSEKADLAKYYLVERYYCLNELSQDANTTIARLAKRALTRFNAYLRFKRSYFDVFKSIDKSICDVSLTWLPMSCVLQSRLHSRLTSSWSHSQGEIRHVKGAYKVTFTLSKKHNIGLSKWNLYRFQKIFDQVNLTEKDLKMTKSNLSLERVVDLVHLFFEYLD